eukprot:TRINITY_DN9464_c0_g1_i1.p1 TRINITY_DN9464_c0_g1~~TRINITY_DN9464_c0_g1_i1.p1  ORF type:complete len:257 (-),score=49.38 TRINITY_DN9464_c0_g1_i1:120-890(-)
MATYDLPSQINYVLSKTNRKTLSYVGHSQGTIQGFAGFSSDPELASRVNVFIALAPVAYVYHTSGLLHFLAEWGVDEIFFFFGLQEFLPDASILQKLAPSLCKWLDWGCADVLFWIAGKTNHLNQTRIDVYVSETPAGTSVKNVVHWSQEIRKNTFGKYDYGCGIFDCENLKHYGQTTPPQYNLSALKLPVALYYGGDDTLADPLDVERIINSVSPEHVVQVQFVPSYAHLDYTWGYDANVFVYQDVLKQLEKFSG